jgi:hypothetical protein
MGPICSIGQEASCLYDSYDCCYLSLIFLLLDISSIVFLPLNSIRLATAPELPLPSDSPPIWPSSLSVSLRLLLTSPDFFAMPSIVQLHYAPL